MRKLIACLVIAVFIVASCSTVSKDVRSYLIDSDSVFTTLQRQSIDSILRLHEKRTSNEIVVKTTDNYGKDSMIHLYATNFLRDLGVGKKDINNGIVIVLNANEAEVWVGTGYGTEHVLTDSIAKRIIDNAMIPHFRNGDLYQGVWNGIKEITAFLERPENKILAAHSEKSRGL